MINNILQHSCRPGEPGEPFVTLTYGHRTINNRECWSFIPPEGFDWDTLPAISGIYFVLSHNRTRLQKIGIANQEQGFQNRIMGGYWGCAHDPEAEGGDKSAAFWYRVMTGNTRDGELSIEQEGQPVEIYFKSYSGQLSVPDIFGVGEELLNYDPHAHLERLLIRRAKSLRQRQGNQELFSANEAYPLLLDSKSRIRRKQLQSPLTSVTRKSRQFRTGLPPTPKTLP